MGAFQQAWKHITGNPGANFAGKRYTFVTFNTEGNVVTPAAGAIAVGVIQEPNNINEPAQVMVHGFSFVQLGATVNVGQEVEVDAAGKAIPLNTGKSVGICRVGGAAGDIGTVLLK